MKRISFVFFCFVFHTLTHFWCSLLIFHSNDRRRIQRNSLIESISSIQLNSDLRTRSNDSNMSYLKSSVNYIWNTNDVLGKGATGAVFKGTNKKTGELVAVKSFNHISHMRPYEVQKREFEVLKKVNHENIVKLLAIEEEHETHQKVLIMELCTGGSLFNILDKPLNYYGLEEGEFMAVLQHLAAGMKHLRDLHIIHRDLKPGNIMKYIGEDGQFIYKLTDFGAARELEEDQQFVSLYGTEEYLHPDMYERAVLHKPAGKSFKANVDLWSIGVTLFHIATGSLPFRPYGGRKNKETMYKITTEKQSGIISGIQHSDNGEIEWSRTLPKTCLLSPDLQRLITPLLAGLMECDAHKMWSFERFFKTVTCIISHKRLHLFDVNHMKHIVLYLHPSETLTELKHRIEIITGCQAKHCLLLFNQQRVHDPSTLQTCSEQNPILLLNSDSTKLKQSPLLLYRLSSFPELPPQTNCDQDAHLAKSCASLSYAIQRVITKCVLYYRLANETPSHLSSYISTNVKLLQDKQSTASTAFTSLQQQLRHLETTNEVLQELIHCIPSNEQRTLQETCNTFALCLQQFDKLSNFWTNLTPRMQYMQTKIRTLHESWPSSSSDVIGALPATPVNVVVNNSNANNVNTFGAALNVGQSAGKPPILYAEARAAYHCTKIRDSWQTLHKDKSTRNLSPSEEQLHHLEKIKIEQHRNRLVELLRECCYRSLKEITERLEDWYTIAQVSLVQSDCLFDEFASFTTDCEKLQRQLITVRDDFKLNLNISVQRIKQTNERQKRLESSDAIDSNLSRMDQALPPIKTLSDASPNAMNLIAGIPKSVLNE